MFSNESEHPYDTTPATVAGGGRYHWAPARERVHVRAEHDDIGTIDPPLCIFTWDGKADPSRTPTYGRRFPATGDKKGRLQ